MSFLSGIQNFVNTIVPQLESKIDSIENNPAGKVGLDILKQLASSIFSKDGKGGVFSEKVTLSLPNPLAKLNKLLGDIGAKFLNGGDLLRNIGAFLTGNRTLENGTNVTVPRLQDRAATSADTTKKLASTLSTGSTSSSTGSQPAKTTSNTNTTSNVSTNKSASTTKASSTTRMVGGSGTVLNQVDGIGGAFEWNGLTKTQQKMMDDAGIDPNTTEGKRMILQFTMQNYSETMQLVSNIAKQQSDISKSIIRNIS